MADTSRSTPSTLSQHQQPPPAPPLPPPHKPSVLQRFIALPAFSRPQRQQGTPVAQSTSASPKDISQDRPVRPTPARNAVHRTGIPISAIDINEQGTHAILAGRDILKTVQVQDRAIHEDLNIRNKVNTYVSIQQLKPEDAHKRREFLPAKDVTWSHGQYSHVIATAAQNGRIALYDVTTMGSSRVELAYLYPHTGQVNKLDFDPHSGYMLLSGSQDRFCKIWDIRNQRSPTAYNQYNVKAPIRSVRWSPTNAFDFALCTENGVVQLWDVRNPSQFRTSINAHSKSCYTIAWHPDGRHLASGGVDKALRIWDMKSENKRQNHVLQVRCPNGVMNLAWKPPTWSAEFAKRGTWQTCHIATSYTDDDSRTHVWDLRRPFLPYREMSNYETRPIDMLWATKDLLWTVGGAGIFAQTDMSCANQPEETLPPGAIEWAADGSFYAVVENRMTQPQPCGNEPSAIFLNVPQDKLSGVDDGTASRSLTDDESTDTSFAEHSRRQSRTIATRTKSHPNTPPLQEHPQKVLPLDRTVVGKRELFINGQVGALTKISGIYIPAAVLEFIANNYARPMTVKERTAQPDQIISRLQNAFIHNAKVCEVAKMVDVAATWRLVAEIVLPELKNWADNNRKRRLQEEESKTREEENRKSRDQDSLSPLPKVGLQGKDGKSPAASEKFVNNMFRGIVGSHRGSSDSGTQASSNMTTPRQQPLPTSPPPSKKTASMWFTLDEAIEPMQPLPPSLANAHSTAAIASRTLLDNNSDPSSPMSSPERSRRSPEKPGHRRSATESMAAKSDSTIVKSLPKAPEKIPSVDRGQALYMSRNQEGRRAALRDFRATSRQPFSLETTAGYAREVRHDSSESFPMFSASGSSSAKARSFGQSFDTTDVPETPIRSRQDSDDWFNKSGYSQQVGGRESYDDIGPSEVVPKRHLSQGADPIAEESLPLPFSLDGASESRPVQATNFVTQKLKEALASSPKDNEVPIKQYIDETPAFDVMEVDRTHDDTTNESHRGFFNRQYHLDNPLLQSVKDQSKLNRVSEHDISTKANYHISDFRPIDITTYDPSTTCFAVSAYPVIAEAIQLDTRQGLACAQFSAHLLSHVQPFFFHQSQRETPAPDDFRKLPMTLADRLLDPCFSSRVIENIFATHIDHLRRLTLFISAAALRKICVEDFDYPHLAGPESNTETSPVGDKLKVDPLKLKSSCPSCKSLLPTNATTCKECTHRVVPCPICDLPLTSGPPDITQDTRSIVHSDGSTPSPSLIYCHTCGHSTHTTCMTTWLTLPDTHGECPTPFCACDCGPGLLRDQRVLRQIEFNETAASTRASSIATSIKRDSKVVGQIPAVDKARESLRKKPSTTGFGMGSSPRGNRTGERDRDEKSTPSSGGTGGSLWGKKGLSGAGMAGSGGGGGVASGRGGAPGMWRSDSGGVGSNSASTSASTSAAPGLSVGTGSVSLGRRVRVVEPDK